MDGFCGNFQEMSLMAQETDDYILTVIQIIIWIQEVFKGFFTIALISNIKCLGH